ncbi:CpsD/CapB family tyrosine-protein kinase, partial [Yangia mangrovi]
VSGRPPPPQPQPDEPAATPRHLITRRATPQAEALWDRLQVFEIDTSHLERNRIITASREDPAHAAFDVLRTRLTQALAENGWTRVGITSPSKGCGKTFTAANLAISMSRQEGLRALLMDLDLRNPSLHKVMGVRAPGAMGALLRGVIPPEAHLMRMGENRIHAGHNIAFGFNEVVEPYAAELLNAPATAEVITSIEARLQPDVMLFDLPPALYYDDVLAFRPQIDGVLMVVGGGLTTEREIREVERRLGTETPLLGMVLNKAEGTNLKKYQY